MEEFRRDEHMRPETTAEALARLKPVFNPDGVVTAGNASGIGDGAAALVIASAGYAKKKGLRPLARLVSWGIAGVDPSIMGIGPVPSSRIALERAGLTLEQMDLVELNEAFASQVIACLRELPIDPNRLNVNGGAIALGHPLGCTGAKLTTTILYEMRRRGARYGLVSMCVGGGMGAAGIFERV
jgi:acetyl-CoA acetyltransferase family protein